MYILKSRGMPHSNQVREFLITSRGLDLIDAFVGPQGVAIGSARLTQEANAKAGRQARREEIERRTRAVDQRRRLVSAQIESLRADLAAEEAEASSVVAAYGREELRDDAYRLEMRQTKVGVPSSPKGSRT
jgi:circadian clock protein KaiC